MKSSTILLIIGVGLGLLGILGFGTSHTLGGFLYVGLLLGFILIVLSFDPRLRGKRH